MYLCSSNRRRALLASQLPFGGKEKLLAVGVFDEVPLAEARERHDEAKRILRSKAKSAPCPGVRT